MVWRSALGSWEFWVRGGELVCGGFLGRCWGGGEETHGDAEQEGFEEGVIFGEDGEDVGVSGDVDEDCEDVFSYGLWIFC